jgi:hypothetical protein
LAYVRKNRVGGHEYYQLVETQRVDGKRRQKMLVHLGRYPSVDEALENLPMRIELSRRALSRYPKKVQPSRERRIDAEEERLATLRRLREQGVA